MSEKEKNFQPRADINRLKKPKILVKKITWAKIPQRRLKKKSCLQIFIAT